MRYYAITILGILSAFYIIANTIIKPKRGLETFLFFFPIIFQARRTCYFIAGPFVISLYSVILLALFFVLIAKHRIEIKLVFYCYFFLVIMFFINLIAAENYIWAIRGWQMILFEPLLTAVIFYSIFITESDTLQSMVMSFFLVFIIIIFEIIISGEFSILKLARREVRLGYGGFTGGYEEPAQLANFLIQFYPIPLFLFVWRRQKIFLAVTVGALCVMFLTLTRSAIITFIVNLLFLIFIYIKNAKKLHIFFLIVFFMLIGGYFVMEVLDIRKKIIVNPLKAEMNIASFAFKLEGSAFTRYYLTIISLQQLFDFRTMIIGRGGLSEVTFWPQLKGEFMSRFHPASSVANGFLTIVIYFGFLPLVLGAYYIIKYFFISFRLKKKLYALIFLDLVVINILMSLLLARGGYVAYGFKSHFPGWKDTDFFYSPFTEGSSFLPLNIESLVLVLAFVAAYTFVLKVQNYYRDN